MPAVRIDGAAMAAEIRGEVAEGAAEMKEKHGVTPGLAAVLVGDDPASAIYVRNKQREATAAGLLAEIFLRPADTSQDEVLTLVARA